VLKQAAILTETRGRVPGSKTRRFGSIRFFRTIENQGSIARVPSTDRQASPDIAQRILILRRERMLLDSDLAGLYGVSTRRLNEQVKRNRDRFPSDFVVQLTRDEWDALRSQNATLKQGRGRHRKYLPLAFTEHGAIMAATVLSSARALEMSIYVVRAFVKLRQVMSSNSVLATKLEALERSIATLDADTRRQFDEIYAAIRALTAQPKKASRPIGFTADLSKDS
jgi:hypothetical protein